LHRLGIHRRRHQGTGSTPSFFLSSFSGSEKSEIFVFWQTIRLDNLHEANVVRGVHEKSRLLRPIALDKTPVSTYGVTSVTSGSGVAGGLANPRMEWFSCGADGAVKAHRFVGV
jgi:hypothetical protein